MNKQPISLPQIIFFSKTISRNRTSFSFKILSQNFASNARYTVSFLDAFGYRLIIFKSLRFGTVLARAFGLIWNRCFGHKLEHLRSLAHIHKCFETCALNQFCKCLDVYSSTYLHTSLFYIFISFELI